MENFYQLIHTKLNEECSNVIGVSQTNGKYKAATYWDNQLEALVMSKMRFEDREKIVPTTIQRPKVKSIELQ